MNATRLRSSVVIGLATTAGALCAATMLATAAAPMARADDFADLIHSIDDDYAAGNIAFALAASDFGSNEFPQGMAQLLSGIDDYSVSPIYNLIEGTIQLLDNQPISGGVPYGLVVPADYADGVALAQMFYSDVDSLFADAFTYFAGGDYINGFDSLFTAEAFATFLPLQELFLGALVS